MTTWRMRIQCNNGCTTAPECYVIRTLPALIVSSCFCTNIIPTKWSTLLLKSTSEQKRAEHVQFELYGCRYRHFVSFYNTLHMEVTHFHIYIYIYTQSSITLDRPVKKRSRIWLCLEIVACTLTGTCVLSLQVTGVLISPQPNTTEKTIERLPFFVRRGGNSASETWLDGQASDFFFFEWLAKV